MHSKENNVVRKNRETENAKFWGDIQVFLPIFQVLTIFENLGYIQILTKIYLNKIENTY